MEGDLENEVFGGGFTRRNGQNQDQQNADTNPSSTTPHHHFHSPSPPEGGVKRSYEDEEREIWLQQQEQREDDLALLGDSLFYTDFIPSLPDFPCMSSSSSSTASSTPPTSQPPQQTPAPYAKPPTVLTSVSSSSSSSGGGGGGSGASSSSSAASWAVLRSDAEIEVDVDTTNSNYNQQHHAELKIEAASHHDDNHRMAATTATAALSSTESPPVPVMMPELLPNHDENGLLQEDGNVDCIDVMESFGCIDLLENNDIWDPSPLFENDNDEDNIDGNHHDLGHHFLHQSHQQSLLLDHGQLLHEQQQQQEGEDALEQFMAHSSGSNNTQEDATAGTVPLLPNNHDEQQQGGGLQEDGEEDNPEDTSRMFFEWLKSNKESISAEDLRSIKIKKSTIESAAKRLGGGRQGMKQLLKLVLEWIQNHLPSKRTHHLSHDLSISGGIGNYTAAVNSMIHDPLPPHPNFVPSANTNNFNQIHDHHHDSPTAAPLNNPNLIVSTTAPDPNLNPSNNNTIHETNPCFSPQPSWQQVHQPLPPPPPPPQGGYVSCADPNAAAVMNPAPTPMPPPHQPPTGYPSSMVGYMTTAPTPDHYYPTNANAAAALSNGGTAHPNYQVSPGLPAEYQMLDTGAHPQWPTPPPQFAMPPPPLPPYATAATMPDGTLVPQPPHPQMYSGYGNVQTAGGVQYPPYQFFPPAAGPSSDHNAGLVRSGSSATKEARKKRMARQRRFLSRNQTSHNHNNTGSYQMMSAQDQHSRMMVEDNCNAAVQVQHGGWVYWPAVAASSAGVTPVGPPTMTGQIQQIADRPPTSTASPGNSTSYQRQIAAAGTDHKKQGWKTEKNLRFLLQKVLKQSDVGNLGRIVLPKKEAETHLPELEARDGITIAMEDIGTSRVWNMRYRFWPNNKSRMYLLENTGDFVRSNGLQEGDFIVIYSDVKCGKYMIRGVKVRPQQQGGSKPSSSDANKIKPAAKVQKTQPLSSPATASMSGKNCNTDAGSSLPLAHTAALKQSI